MRKISRAGTIMRPTKESLRASIDCFIQGIESGKDVDYILLGGEDVASKLITQMDRFKGVRYKENHLTTIDVDGVKTVAFWVTKGYVKDLRQQTTVHQIYSSLANFFTDGDLRMLFHDLWVQEKNYLASEANRKEHNKTLGHRHKVSKDFQYIKHLTTSMTKTESERSSL